MSHWQAATIMYLGFLCIAICYAISLYLLPLSVQEFRRASAAREFLGGAAARPFNSVSQKISPSMCAQREGNKMYGILVQDNREPKRRPRSWPSAAPSKIGPDSPRVDGAKGDRQELDRKTGKLSVLYFKRYSFGVNLLGEERREWREPGERLVHELLKFPTIRRTTRFLSHQAHRPKARRIVTPLLALTLPFIALFVLLPGQFNKRGQLPRLLAVVVAAAVPGPGGGVPENSFIFVPLMYLNALAPLAGAGRLNSRMPHTRAGAAVEARDGGREVKRGAAR